MDFKDYYKILGLEKGADVNAVKKAYRKLAAKYHPDKNPGKKAAEDKFKEINEANEVLSDPEKRKRYDAMGSAWNQPGGQPGSGFEGFTSGGAGGASGRSRPSRGGQGPTFSQEDLAEMFGGGGSDSSGSDFFETFFGGRMGGRSQSGKDRWSGKPTARAGVDYQADVEITLEEAYQGAKKIIELNEKKLRLQFKPGIAEGKVIKLAGKGGQGQYGGPDGDFYLRIHVTPHPELERREDDLYLTLPLEVQDAVLGKQIEIKTLNGSIKLKVPPMTDNGKVFRLKGQGMPVYDKPGHLGDLYVTVSLRIPKNLTAADQDLFRQLAANLTQRTSA
jgi:curved DNA-binding protein